VSEETPDVAALRFPPQDYLVADRPVMDLGNAA
jgi:hypothetical protein